MVFKKFLSAKSEILLKVSSSLKNNESLLLTYFNQNSFNCCFESAEYKNLIENEFSVYPDGIGIFLFQKYLMEKKFSRIDATELNAEILNLLQEDNIRVGIIGGNFDEKFMEGMKEKRRLNLAGYQNGFFKDSELPEIVRRVKSFNAAVFIVAMGVPKQELFAAELKKHTEKKVIICVGNFMEYFFETQKRAPEAFQRLGIEWIYRLLSEPWRLGKRYLIGIPKFVFRAVKIKIINKKEFA